MDTRLLPFLRARLAASGPRFLERLGGQKTLETKRLCLRGRDAARRLIARLPHPDRGALARIQPATILVVAVGLSVAVAGYLSIGIYGSTRIQRDLDRAAVQIAERIADSLDGHVALAERTAAQFAGPKENVNRWAFFEFARTIAGKTPSLGAIEWIPRVPESRRAEFESRARADGLFDFRFAQRAADGVRTKASERPEYFPVYFVEPYPGNEAELGLDLAADPGSAKMLTRVRDAGATSAVPDAAAPQLSIVVPVYRSGVVPFTVGERRSLLSGFIRARFRLDKLLQTATAGIGGAAPLEFYIFDRSGNGKPSLMYFLPGTPGATALSAERAHNGAIATVEQRLAGWRWTLLVRPARGTFQGILAIAAWGFVAFTLLLTALLVRHLAKMQIAREKAEAANRTKSDFLAMMCHELRTPLNSVIGFSDLMVNELFGPLKNDHYREYTAHINRSATHLLSLINTILNFSNAEAGSFRLEKEDFALGEIWRSVADDFQPNLRNSDVELHENLSDTPLRLHADPNVFRQILHNLVSNAIKFTPRGGTVTVTAARDSEGGLSLRVTDTGIGISEANIDLVFKPFRQVDNSLSREYEGIGLGLPLTRMLVELHGGGLSIESRLGEGTEIRLGFPAGIIADDTPAPVLPAESAAPAGAEGEVPGPADGAGEKQGPHKRDGTRR